jgi:hypothetical protein
MERNKMSVFIKIRLSSIRKNPDYAPGCRKYINGVATMTFTCKGPLPISFKEGENIAITTRNLDFIDGLYYEGYVIGDIDVEALQREKSNVVLSVNREPIEITSNEPEYLYEYIPVDVICSNCGRHFLSSALQSDSYYDGEEYYYNDEVCPKCQAWGCLDEELKYETIEEALNRKKKK